MSSQEVEIRTLADALKDDESFIEEWYAHVVEVFGSFGMPEEARQTFFRHQINTDPWADMNWIFYISDDKNKIASGLHVYQREMYVLDIEPLTRIGGIGEVSTKKDSEKQGHAKALLKHAHACLEDQGAVVSTLHASVPDYYAKLDYKRVPHQFSQISAESLDGLPEEEAPLVLEHVDNPNEISDEDLSAICEIHASYARNFIGVLRRNEKYWREWIFKDSTFVKKTRHLVVVRRRDDPDKSIVGYAMYEKAFPRDRPGEDDKDGDKPESEPKEEKLPTFLVEFGVTKALMDEDEGRAAFVTVAKYAMENCEADLKSMVFAAPIGNKFKPSPLKERIEPSPLFSNPLYPFMIRAVSGRVPPDVYTLAHSEKTVLRDFHIFWRTDFF